MKNTSFVHRKIPSTDDFTTHKHQRKVVSHSESPVANSPKRTHIQHDKVVAAQALYAELTAAGAEHPLKTVAETLGIPRGTVRRWKNERKLVASVANDNASAPEEKPEPYRLGGSPADRKIIQLTDENHRLREALKAAHRDGLNEDVIRDIIGTISMAPTSTPNWVRRLRTAGPRIPEAPMTMWSDPHGGEVVQAAEVNGVNEYNVDIMKRRFNTLVDRTIGICDEHGPGDYPGIIINLAGDNVSGGLHPELQKTDELEIIPAVLEVRDMLVWGLRRMADRFGQVYAPAVAGNHGRGTPKPEYKRYIYKNFDWLIYELLRREFADDPRIVIDTRPANEVFYSVYGHRFMLVHGDMLGVKGGDGIIGAIGPIMRGEIKTRGASASAGMEYDTLLMGHWHQQLWLPRAIVSNTMKGYDEYAKNALRAPISAPTQPLWFMHHKYGITSKWDIHLEDPKPKAQATWAAVFDPAARNAA
ncbi:hypothetical protein [Devosia nitrariae]|uniref:Uncharacterized protein n=1 Tax=Devosia nitrariae TaxID=2071872 RepID=A0ABQ5W0Y8_9HYPH|nr:hypothetical protein [Devosia nitrariae]GLQ53580.1 hypothetical protein GCM10010862_08390 [Devosia nitrariae]